MTQNEAEKIKFIMVSHFPSALESDSLLDSLSSLELVHLVTELESAFKISISALEINDSTFKNIESLTEFVHNKIS